MTAPFTASNGYEVVPGGHYGAVVQELIRPDGASTLARDIDRDDLLAFVEYAATIGITAEPSEEA